MGFDGEEDSIEEIVAEQTFAITFDASARCLRVPAKVRLVAVYTIDGQLVGIGAPQADGTFSVESLPVGVYAAMATDGASRAALKFIIR